MEEEPLSLPLLGFLRQLERDIIMSILSFKKKMYDQSEEKRGPGGKGGLAKTSVLFTMRFFFEVGFIQGKQGSFHLRGWAVVLRVCVHTRTPRTHTRTHTRLLFSFLSHLSAGFLQVFQPVGLPVCKYLLRF